MLFNAAAVVQCCVCVGRGMFCCYVSCDVLKFVSAPLSVMLWLVLIVLMMLLFYSYCCCGGVVVHFGCADDGVIVLLLWLVLM